MALKRIFALCVGGLSVLCLIPFVARAVRTDVARDFPVYQNHGLPDLTIDPKRLVSQMEIVDRLFDSSSCEVIEGSIGGTGYRRLLRFDTVIINGAGVTSSSAARLIQTTPIIRSSIIRHATGIITFSDFLITNC
jgi:hypothetical protein